MNLSDKFDNFKATAVDKFTKMEKDLEAIQSKEQDTQMALGNVVSPENL